MPSRGVDIVDGIPVSLKGGVIYAFHSVAASPQVNDIRLGTYDSVSKKATWEPISSDAWLTSFREGLVSRTRK